MTRISLVQLIAIVFACCLVGTAQTPKTLSKDNLSFDYPDGWTLADDSNSDAQQFTLTKSDLDVQIRVFVHKGRITADKLPEAKKAFIDPYINAMAKQFVAMGATPQQSPDASEMGGMKADGVNISASLGGETGAAKIYWAVVGNRVVLLTLFGPDNQTKRIAPVWDTVRNSLKVHDPKAAPSASPSPNQ